ncbi:MAG: Gfo/Idh/MocA family oxidoreductase [Candidatus Dormiibacterota bacterium]
MRLALIGCGFMGQRHVRGLGRLRDIAYPGVELAAVCDTDVAQATAAADLAESLLGRRPQIVTVPARLPEQAPEVEGVIVATPPAVHEATVGAALESGLHVLVEKPLSLTVGSARRIVAAAQRARRLLAVAENYRRDPVNRLARALLDAGVIGDVYRAEQRSTGTGGQIAISVWRHRKQTAGILVDMGVHYADVLEYLLGPFDTLTGRARRIDDRRRDRAGRLHDVDAEDVCSGLATMASGAIVEWSMDYAARGDRLFRRVLHGSRGTLQIPHDRSGEALRLWLEEAGTVRELAPAEIPGLVPDARLDDVTAALFGGERAFSYELPFATIDANLLAIEQADFADAVAAGRPPEVGGAAGLSALAVAYGWLDASAAGGTVQVSELLAGGGAYQSEIVDPVPAGGTGAAGDA